MKQERKLLIAVLLGAVLLLGMGTWIGGIFNVSGQAKENDDKEMTMTYQTYSITTQEPVALTGVSQLKTDHSYFYNAENGKLDVLNVTDGQTVSKGDLLFTYNQDKAKYDVQDLEREQTKLYNQRETLIEQLKQQTGLSYNYQGDQIAANWTGNGKAEYYVVVPIGQGYTTTTAANSENEEDQAAGADSEGLKSQIRQVNDQIAEVEIKLLRAKEGQYSRVITDFSGKVMVDEAGLYDTSIPLVRVISDDVVVTGSVGEYEFYLLGDKRQANLFVNAENREVSGQMIDYDKIPAAQAQTGDTSKNSGGAISADTGAKYGFTIVPDDYIQPGFTVKVNIVLPGYLIPNDALIQDASGSYVFVYQEGKAHKQKVTIEKQGLNSVVYRGLEEGQEVILMPFDLQDGQAVEISDGMAQESGE